MREEKRIPPFHRWVLVFGLVCLAMWLPFNLFREGDGLIAEVFQSLSGDLSDSLYTFGYWLTLMGAAFEVAYVLGYGWLSSKTESQALMDASGRSRFRRSKRKFVLTSDMDKDGKRVSLRP